MQRLLHSPAFGLLCVRSSSSLRKVFGDFFVLRRISRGGARSKAQSPTSSATDRVISPNSEDWPRLDLGSTSRIKQLGTDTGSRLFLIGPRSGALQGLGS